MKDDIHFFGYQSSISRLGFAAVSSLVAPSDWLMFLFFSAGWCTCLLHALEYAGADLPHVNLRRFHGTVLYMGRWPVPGMLEWNRVTAGKGRKATSAISAGHPCWIVAERRTPAALGGPLRLLCACFGSLSFGHESSTVNRIVKQGMPPSGAHSCWTHLELLAMPLIISQILSQFAFAYKGCSQWVDMCTGRGVARQGSTPGRGAHTGTAGPCSRCQPALLYASQSSPSPYK